MKKIAILTLIMLGIPMGLFAIDPQIVIDANKSAKWISTALTSSGYKADFSSASKLMFEIRLKRISMIKR